MGEINAVSKTAPVQWFLANEIGNVTPKWAP
jgi:hypothetical protein